MATKSALTYTGTFECMWCLRGEAASVVIHDAHAVVTPGPACVAQQGIGSFRVKRTEADLYLREQDQRVPVRHVDGLVWFA